MPLGAAPPADGPHVAGPDGVAAVRSALCTTPPRVDRWIVTTVVAPQAGPGGRDLARRPPRTAAEHRSLSDDLSDPHRWPDAAAALLANLGFRLVAPSIAGDDAHLLVALRAHPERTHFDPEAVTYFAPDRRGGARLAHLDRHDPIDGVHRPRTALWGHLHVIDRVPVENRFLTFGGDLRTAAIDDTLTVVDLWSPAPIARWSGHSQGTDELAPAIGAFFGRLMVPVDFVPGAEERLDGTLPEVLYRAFLEDAARRRPTAPPRDADHAAPDRWLGAAQAAARQDPVLWAAAGRLLADLGI